jgi:hypothetical protein
VASPDDFLCVSSWLQTCLTSHKQCGQVSNSSLPTRVLDVSAGDNHNLVRLVSGADIQGVYATLSHCWGNLPVQTCSRASISELRRNVPWESLCKTFQDAILVARGLSIKYLWIDSLCIIQDDNDDCQREIGNMACIYSNGCVNIAAAASVNGSGGCFANYRRYMTPWERLPAVDLRWMKDGQSHGVVKVGSLPMGFQSGVEWGPLAKRGWVVQERILAKRIVYYGEDQLYWDCAEGRESECGIDVSFYGSKDLGSNGGFRMLKASIEHGDEEVWERVVELYTRCDLTKPDDKLPALSGIATTYAAATGMTYIAGLWKERLPCQLLWTVARSPQSTHLSFYRAPSFSWASIDGAVSFYDKRETFAIETQWVIRVLSVTVDTEGSSPYGKVTRGTLTLRGKIKPAVGFFVHEGGIQLYGGDDSKRTIVGDGKLDEPELQRVDDTVYCLLAMVSIHTTPPAAQIHFRDKTYSLVHVLLLRHITGQPQNTYYRVGTGRVSGKEWFADVKESEMILF